MNVAVQHPTGNRNVRSVLSAFHENGMLAAFFTTFAVDSDAGWLKLLPAGMRRELTRRAFPLPADKIHTFPYREISRMLMNKIGWKYPVRHERGWACVDAVYRNIDKSMADALPKLKKNKNITAVYAYEDGAFSTFTRAKEFGLTCIYDLPIAYWETGRRLMREESERLPSWSQTLGGGLTDSAEKIQRKTLELQLADIVVCPGKFVQHSLPTWARQKDLIVAPFGSPKLQIPVNRPAGNSNKPLRVLFAGSMGQRKGLGDLFAAMKLLDHRHFELIVMGTLRAPLSFYKDEYPFFVYEPGRSHEEVLALMRTCDIFCLPSIVEGRALVVQEAMSQGLPIIITPNTGGDDLVIEGETGFLLPIRSPEAIAEKLSWFHKNRSRIPEMGRQAQQHAATYTWTGYGAKIIEGLMKFSNINSVC